MPGPAIDILIDLREQRMGGTPRRLALSLVDDGADERVAERDVAVLDDHEPIGRGRLQVGDVELGLPERGGQRLVSQSEPCGNGEQQRPPRPLGKPCDTCPERALDAAVDGNRLTELVDPLKLRVGERGRQLDERERIPCGELEEPPSDRRDPVARAPSPRAAPSRLACAGGELEPRQRRRLPRGSRPRAPHRAVRREASTADARRTRATPATARRPIADRRPQRATGRRNARAASTPSVATPTARPSTRPSASSSPSARRSACACGPGSASISGSAGREELGERREREIGLRLATGRAERRHVRSRAAATVVEQHASCPSPARP